ncbi:MAG: hypothetical protein ACPGVO_10660 [Spirulinaceae cyanobacterium]
MSPRIAYLVWLITVTVSIIIVGLIGWFGQDILFCGSRRQAEEIFFWLTTGLLSGIVITSSITLGYLKKSYPKRFKSRLRWLREAILGAMIGAARGMVCAFGVLIFIYLIEPIIAIGMQPVDFFELFLLAVGGCSSGGAILTVPNRLLEDHESLENRKW